MNDVATYVGWKCFANALFYIPLGIIFLGVPLVGVPIFVYNELQEGNGSWSLLGIVIAAGFTPSLLGAVSFTLGLQQMRAAFEKNCWLRAGPEGISGRMPGKGRLKSLYLTYDIVERTIPWNDVVKMYPYVFKAYGITLARRLIIVTHQGKSDVDGVYFRERPSTILAAILREAKANQPAVTKPAKPMCQEEMNGKHRALNEAVDAAMKRGYIVPSEKDKRP